MRIHAFIFNWRGHSANAQKLEAALSRCTKTTVINSEELDDAPAHWVNIGDEAYFSAQWNKALELFDGDLMFHIQADARYEAFELMFERARTLFDTYRLGIYEPNVHFTEFKYDTHKLRRIGPRVFEVPLTDCTCWFVSKDVASLFPRVDLSINKYGWGIPVVAAAIAASLGKRCVRDYTFTVRHPMGSSYSTSEARQHRSGYLTHLPSDLKARVVDAYRAYYGARPGRVKAVQYPKWLARLKKQLF